MIIPVKDFWTERTFKLLKNKKEILNIPYCLGSSWERNYFLPLRIAPTLLLKLSETKQNKKMQNQSFKCSYLQDYVMMQSITVLCGLAVSVV